MTEKIKRKFDKRALIVIFIATVVIAGTLFIFQPKEKQVVAGKTNTEVFSSLLKGGIEDSNTVEDGNTVKVTYQLPSSLEREKAELYILGVLSTLTPNKENAVVSTYSGDKKLGEIEVPIDDILKYKNSEITLDQFKGKIRKL